MLVWIVVIGLAREIQPQKRRFTGYALARVAIFSDIYVKVPRRAAEEDRSTAVDFAVKTLGFVPDEKQRSMLESTAKRRILNCSRQWGKSSVAAVKAVHHVATGENRLVVVASRSERQSAEFLRKAATFVRKAGFRARGTGITPFRFCFPMAAGLWDFRGQRTLCGGFRR